MFSSEERDGAKTRILEIARNDARITSCALVGSSASNGDRWSDLDITFGVQRGVKLEDVVCDWTGKMEREFGAIFLFDLPYLETLYRVFLFPGCLQVDLSFTPQDHFGALGPRFQLLWGKSFERTPVEAPSKEYLFGLAVHHLLRGRICIERERLWQAEYWISSARDTIFAILCLERDLLQANARGVDQLPKEILLEFGRSIIESIDKTSLTTALNEVARLLFKSYSAYDARTSKIESQLRHAGFAIESRQ